MLGKFGFPFVPEVFTMPDQLSEAQAFARNNPNTLFLTKANSHHQIRFIRSDNFSQIPNTSHVQVAVDPPLLFMGYKFDLSAHVIISCVDPLKIFVSR